MVRFKRSLATRPVLETASAKVAKPTVLNEGFALPVLATFPIPSEVVPEPIQRDGPEAIPYGRGNRDTAMAHARDPARCRAALLKDSYAKTSMGPIESRIKRWDTLARASGFHDPFDLSPEVIYAVMGALKLAGYRSAEQYLEAAKLEFFNSGGVWSDQLRQAARAAVRSCNRGIGCAKQAKGLPLAELHKVKSGLALVPGGPVFPGRATLLASWWLLREIEASQARRKHVTLDHMALRVSWRLPSSKADWKALGATRSHKCSCRFTPVHLCPYHNMVDHLRSIGDNPEDPIFPSSDGRPASKQGWADTFQEIASQLGLPSSHPNGARCWTGHTARVSGAMHMAAANIELWRIQIYGRWGSPAFLLYIRDAPIQQLDSLAMESSAQLSIQAAQHQLKDLLQQVQTAKDSLQQCIALPTASMLEDCEATAPPAPEPTSSDRLVKNRSSGGKVHLTQWFDPDAHPRQWRTRCAWQFGLQETDYEFVSEASNSIKCQKCFPALRKRRKPNSSSSSSTSSSSSSSA